MHPSLLCFTSQWFFILLTMIAFWNGSGDREDLALHCAGCSFFGVDPSQWWLGRRASPYCMNNRFELLDIAEKMPCELWHKIQLTIIGFPNLNNHLISSRLLFTPVIWADNFLYFLYISLRYEWDMNLNTTLRYYSSSSFPLIVSFVIWKEKCLIYTILT